MPLGSLPVMYPRKKFCLARGRDFFMQNFLKVLFTISAFITIGTFEYVSNRTTAREYQPHTIISAVGDPSALETQYKNWKQNIGDQANHLQFNLWALKQHTINGKKGEVLVDTKTGLLSAKIFNPEDKPLSLYLTRNGARLYEQTAEADKSVIKAGDFDANGYLSTSVKSLLSTGFQFEQFVVAEADALPLKDPLLAGSASLFQRLYASEKSQQEDTHSLIPVAQASVPSVFPEVFNTLVAEGEDLFFNEGFAGNGRNCGTCHPAENNFTIDVPFIRSLPRRDPLFVAEFVPALIFGHPANLDENGRPQRFENPALMRSFGLIVENVDGLGDVENRFTMRSVQHNIGMTVSVDARPQSLTPPEQRTGWSGDGAPVGVVGGVVTSGRLRDFIVGAIVQHYPKTMARSFDGPRPDFRAPTPRELDALEAFIFSIGRKAELQITPGSPNELILANQDAETGKTLFINGAGTGPGCGGCHGQAGANILAGPNQGNANINTGVEAFLQNNLNNRRINIPGEPRPVDGGFGLNPDGTFDGLTPQPGFTNENFGDMRFNTVSVVESADTAPFFHNNIATTVEDSIRFYNTQEFIDAVGAGIPFDDRQVAQVAAFMRAINALDNIENHAMVQARRARRALRQTPVNNPVITRILEICIADTEDAIQVLRRSRLHSSGPAEVNAVVALNQAVLSFNFATAARTPPAERRQLINTGIRSLRAAVNIIRE